MPEEVSAKWAKLVELASSRDGWWIWFTFYDFRFSILHKAGEGDWVLIEVCGETILADSPRKLGDFVRRKVPSAEYKSDGEILSDINRELEISLIEEQLNLLPQRLAQLKQAR